jgi:hypothetical protein
VPVTVAVAVTAGVSVGCAVGVAVTPGVSVAVTAGVAVGDAGLVTRAMSMILAACPRMTLLFGRK